MRLLVEIVISSFMDHVVRQLTLRDGVLFLAGFVSCAVLMEIL